MVYLLPFAALAALYLLINRRDARLGILIAGGIGIALFAAVAGRDLLFPSGPPDLAPDQIELSDVVLIPGERTTTVTARALNLSEEESIYELEMRLTLSDCVDDTCLVIGEGQRSTVQRIPPQQLRDIRFTFLFNDLPAVQGTLDWEAEIVALRARR